MTARVLVVDDVLANVKLLEARLSAEYFEVLTAYSGTEALEILERERVDVVVLDVMMPGIDGYEVCRRIKCAPKTMHIPVIMVTALDQTSDKVHGLEAGADDFLPKPIDDVALITRVRNLARLKALNDEMISRVAGGAGTRFAPAVPDAMGVSQDRGRILLVDDRQRSVERVFSALSGTHEVSVESDLNAALLLLAEGCWDLLIVSLGLSTADGLRLCGQVRSLARTRHLPIIVLLDPNDNARLLRALEMGVNDYVTRPFDRNELSARVRTQIKRKRHNDLLRERFEENIELALTDPLTGLFNRRYLDQHLKGLTDQALASGRPLSLLVADIDHFKRINDSYGHDSGDDVLRAFGARFRRNIRAADVACRLGGEEFVVIMPDTGLQRACQVGERLRACIAGEPFLIHPRGEISVTASVGIATLEQTTDTPETLFRRADRALYAAKRDGRNRIAADAA